MIGYISEKIADVFYDKVKAEKENIDLRNVLFDYLKRQKEEFDQSVFEYDFDELMSRIEVSLLNETTLGKLIDPDPETRNQAKESIRISCVQAALNRKSLESKEPYDTSIIDPVTGTAPNCLHSIEKVHKSDTYDLSEIEKIHKSDTYELAEIDPIHVRNKRGAQQKVEEIVNQCLHIIVAFYDSKILRTDSLLACKIVDAVNAHADVNKAELKQEIGAVISVGDEVLKYVNEIKAALPQEPASPPKQADNQDYLDHFYAPLFLEKRKSKVTLASMYVSPHIKNKDMRISAAECIMQWYNDDDIEPCLLLYGNAGVGKSSLVSKIIADANQKDGAEREFDLPSDQVLAVALRDHCDQIDMSKKADKIIESLFEGCALDELQSKLLILDGVDEVCVLKHGFNGRDFLEKMSKLETGFHVLVTSRDAKDYFDDPSNIEDLQIAYLQWDADEVKTWCEKYSTVKPEKNSWCKEFDQEFSELDQEDHRREIFCVPIILYICGNSGISLSDHNSIGSIYRDAFRKILLRQHLRRQGDYTDLTEADVQSNLIAWQYTKELAYQMFLHDTLDLAESDDQENPHTKGLKNARLRTKAIMKEKYGIDVADNALDIKKELALCPFTKANGATGITFAHKTVYEYFTAVKLYEDYFANFDTKYFGLNSKEAPKAVIEAAVAAFRYKAIPEDIFHYLCEMHDAPFNGKEESASESGLDVKHFTTAFVQAMEGGVLDRIAVTEPIPEYLTSQNTYNKCNTQITRAFRALLCFLTGHGFRNKNGSAACKQIRDMLFASDQIVNLEQWDLIGADLQEAKLQGAKLQGAKLQGAKLQEAKLQEAKLLGANLLGAKLQGAKLQEAKLQWANLQWAKLQWANLQEAVLIKADLQEANLLGAKLQEAKLQEAELQGANLQEANLQEANLQEANLLGANLLGANLLGAELLGANLLGANLLGAELLGAELLGANLLGAKYCKDPYFETVFPEGFNPKEHGMIEVDKCGNPVV